MIKKLFILLLLFVSLISIGFSFSGGDGSVGNPYNISTCIELNETRNDLSVNYQLINSFSCSDTVTWDDRAGWDPIGYCGGASCVSGGDDVPFTGTFNGNGFSISDLYINRTQNGIGLFGYISGSDVKNLKLIDMNLTVTGNHVGGLVGYSSSSSSV